MKPQHRQKALGILHFAKQGKPILVLGGLRDPKVVAAEIRELASEQGQKLSVRVASNGIIEIKRP